MVAINMPRQQILQLGRILLSKKPDIAQALLAEYLPHTPPIETDLEKIPEYFIRFCHINQLKPCDNTGPLYKADKINERRVFIAAMICLYNPSTRLLSKYLALTLNQDPSNTAKMIQEVEFRYRKMEDFKAKVDEVIGKLKIDNN